MLSHVLDNRLTDGDEFVGLMRRPCFTPSNNPGAHICQRLSKPQDLSAAGLGQLNIPIARRTEPETFQLVADWLNELRYNVPPFM
jgi:hypothetical protein